MKTWVFCILVFPLLAALGFASEPQWQKKIQLPGKPEVHIRATDATVQIRSGEKSDVEVRIFSESGKKGEFTVDDKSLSNVLSLEVNGPAARLVKPSDNSTLRIEVLLPREASVTVSCRNGDVKMEGLRGLFGVSTGVGRIDIKGAEGSVQANSLAGDIQIDGVFSIVRVTAHDGEIKVRAEAGSKIQTEPWVLVDDHGDISIMLSADFGADLEAHSEKGNVSVDMPLAGADSQDTTRVKGKLDHGGGALAVLTHDGKIHIGHL